MAACNHPINFHAVRAYRRAWYPAMHEMQEAADMDSQFDAGEFSGPAWGRMYEREESRILAQVASAFGLAPRELERMDNCAFMHEQDVLISKGLY